MTEPVDAVSPSVGDLLRYLWARRVRLLVLFVLLSGIGGAALLAWWVFGSRSAHGVIALGFRGIERHEYPSGKVFAIEDIRSPRVLTRALEDVGLAPGSYDLQEIYRGIDLVPIVPASVVERWKKQDRDGAKREEFLPSEFALDVHPRGLDDAERVRLLYALMQAYQDQVKYEQEAEQHRIAHFAIVPAAQLTTLYDYWDIPILLRFQADSLAVHLAALVRESQNFRDPTLNLSFLDVGRELDAWRITRLEALAAVVHRERLVKDREAMLRRLEERHANLQIELRKIKGHTESTSKLLEVIEQSKPVLASQAAVREGAPLLDVTALEKVLKSDYVGPVVRRASELHEEEAATAASSERVEREISLLTQAGGKSSATPPAGFEDFVVLVAEDLDRIVGHYLRVLDSYLAASVTRHVTLREGPYLRLAGPQVTVIAVAIVFVAALLSLLIVIVSDSLHRRPPGADDGPHSLRPT